MEKVLAKSGSLTLIQDGNDFFVEKKLARGTASGSLMCASDSGTLLHSNSYYGDEYELSATDQKIIDKWYDRFD